MFLNKMLVDDVYNDSAAKKAGIEKGDYILEINGNKVTNILEYTYLCADDHLNLKVQKNDGVIKEVKILNRNYNDIGISFDQKILNEPVRCCNKCVFCFIDQLPDNMRKSLYIKDDDSTMSFLNGNFITLTNMSDEDLDRIIKFKISPINVSVHTTNPDLRAKMLNNKNAGKILKQLERLCSNNIKINCQIVLCPGINDGDELNRTIEDLYKFYPQIENIAVVPVGVTKFRKQKIEIFNKESSQKLIDMITPVQKYYDKKIGEPFVRIADEFYIMAGRDLPILKHYGEFEQLEDGIGMVKYFEHNIAKRLSHVKFNGEGARISFVTGYSFYDCLVKVSKKIEEKLNIKIDVYKIVNNYFGETITVTGLITATDIIDQVKGRLKSKYVFISKSMLKADEDIFLDDITLEQLSNELGVKIIKCEYTGEDIIKNITNEVEICQNL